MTKPIAKIWPAFLSFIAVLSWNPAWSQALNSNPIQLYGGGDAPGFRYFDTATKSSYNFEMHFVIDPVEFTQAAAYLSSSCSASQGYGVGFYLYDRHPNTGAGWWIITLGTNRELCYKDSPQGYTASVLRFANLQLGVPYVLSATRTAQGLLTVRLNQEVCSVQQSSAANYRGGSGNGIGIAREINGFHAVNYFQSFPGSICEVRDDGVVITFDQPLQTLYNQRVTGTATLGPDICGVAVPPPPPPPPPTNQWWLWTLQNTAPSFATEAACLATITPPQVQGCVLVQ